MTADWPKVRATFERASELPPAQRAAFLDAEVGAGTPERAAVERLLAALPGTDGFLAPPGAATLGAAGVAALAPGAVLGPFRVVRPLARGGMGSVFVAEQDHPARTIALKVMHHGLAVPRARERFRAEIDALARLQHPGIAPVFTAGVEADGTAWFAMELLAGAEPVTAFAAQCAAPWRERLRLFLQVTAAVQHAHQRGVIHRDLKPANVLVLPDGTAKVIDFGIARLLDADRSGPTLGGELLGTLAYMAPEQLAGGETDVRTDVYGLGVVLFELLAGALPFALGDLPLTEACRTIATTEAPPLSSRAAGLPRELDWVVGRALQKDRDARYAGVAEFAADVARVLADEPVLAGPDSAAYRLRKFVRRHRVGVGAAAAVLAVTVGSFVAVTSALWRAQAAETAERAGRAVAEANANRAAASLDFLLDVFSSVDPGKDGKEVKMVDALGRAARDFGVRFAAEPTIRAALGEAIGKTRFGLGMLPDAERDLQDAVAVHEQCHGPMARETGQALAALGYVQLRAGKQAEAEASLARAAAIAEATGDAPLRLVAGMHRADLLRAKGDKPAAAKLLAPIVDELRRVRGPAHRDTWAAVTLLAGIRHELGDLDGAEPLYREALTQVETLRGPEHQDTLTARNNFATFLFSRGRRAEALPFLEQVLAGRQKLLGADHPDTLNTLCNLGAAEFGLSRYEAAAAHFAEALGKLGPKVGDKSPIYRALLGNLATAERELGRFGPAAEHGEQAVALYVRDVGPTHPSTLMTHCMLADVHRQAGEPARALALFTKLRDAARDAAPPQPANVYRAELGMARCRLAAREFAEAEALFLHLRQTFDASEKAASTKGQLTHPDGELVQLYEAWGKPDEAAKYRKAEAPAKKG